MPPSFRDARKGIDETPGTAAVATVQPKAGCGANANDRRGCGYRCRCCRSNLCNLFSTIRYCRRNDRMGTLIRHAGLRAALPIPALPVSMIQSSFRAALMTATGRAALSLPRCCAAGCTTIALPAVTVRANEEQHVAGAAQTEPRPQNRPAMNSHAPGVRALTTAIRSWELRTSFDVWLTFP